MFKKTDQDEKEVKANSISVEDKTELDIKLEEERVRPKRKKVYERIRETQIPQEVHDIFRKQGYELKPVRWAINGVEDFRYLARRENEGYEFVDASELPAWFLPQLRLMDTRNRRGLVTVGDLCLMKVDVDLRNSRRDYYNQDADREVQAVDVHVLEKKGFRNLGTKSKVILREPTFSD